MAASRLLAAYCEVYDLTLYGTLKPQSNGPLYSNMVIATLAVDG